MEQAVKPFREIRDAVGMQMEIAVELHSRWNLPCAIRIAEALEEIKPLWYEDPIQMDNPEALAQFARSTRVPTTASETMTNRAAFRQMLDTGAIGIVMLDTGWVGGISEGHAIGKMAETYHRPFAPHDCTGPITFIRRKPTCASRCRNAMIQEGVRAYYKGGWYENVVTVLPAMANGFRVCTRRPRPRTRLQPEFLARPDVVSRTTEAA